MTTDTTKVQRFSATLGRTPAGSLRIQLKLVDPSARGNYRERAACVYEVAAELERQSGECDANWCVSPDAPAGRIDVELVSWADAAKATRFVLTLLAGLGAEKEAR